MKKLFFFLTISVFLSSCEKSTDVPVEILPDGFSQKLFDGYFIKSIAFDNLGNAWIGTFRQGLIKYNPAKTRIYNSKNSIIPDSFAIWDIEVDSKNNVWIGADGLIKYDGDHFTKYNSSNTPIPEDYVSCIAIDSDDNLWFTSCRFRQGGIVNYNGTDWNVYTPENSDLPANLVQSIAVDNDDNIWIAVSQTVNDPYLVKISGDTWTPFTSSDLGFTPYYISSIKVNSQNKICGANNINTGAAQLFIFDGNTSETFMFDTFMYFKSITIDDQDNIWCCGSHGNYCIFDGQQWTIDYSLKGHGIFTIEQAPDQKIWIGTGNGVYIKD